MLDIVIESYCKESTFLVCFLLVRLATTVVFVPSHRDVHHDFVYPQPPFSSKVNTAEFNVAEV